ncbi:hypothetical protein ACFL2G_04745 [Candidatus Omnitrophota bacterium]
MVNPLYAFSTTKDGLRVPIQTDKRKDKYLAIVLHQEAIKKTESLIFNIQNLADYKIAKDIQEKQSALDFHIETIKFGLEQLMYPTGEIKSTREHIDDINMAFENAESILGNIENIVKQLDKTSLNIDDTTKGIARYREILSEFNKSYIALKNIYDPQPLIVRAERFYPQRWTPQPIVKWSVDTSKDRQSPLAILRQKLRGIVSKILPSL